MANKLQVKRTSTSGRTPNTTSSGNTQFIDAGELALNMADGILYTSNGSALISVGANQVSINVTSSARLPGQTANTIGLYPLSNTSGYLLGNTTARWSLTALDISTSTLSAATIGVTRLYTTATSSSFEANSYTTGNILLGGVNQTGYVLVGQSTNNQTVAIANGATISGNVKTISIGENGAAGSQTNITIGSSLSNTLVNVVANNTFLNNNGALRFRTVNTAASAYFIQQNDDNFVFYTTDASYNPRPVFSIFANSSTSDFQLGQPVTFNSPNVKFSTSTALYANGSAGSNGQLLTSNGTALYWSTPGAASVNTNAQWAWTNTHSFSANVTFTGNNINLTTNTGSLMFAGVSDTNWRIGRNTGATTKFYYSNNTLDIIAADSNLEGFVIGKPGGNTYLETGYAGTFTKNPIYVGNATVNVTINSTSFSGTSNNSVYLGGIGGGSYLRSDVDDQFSGAILQVYNDTGVLGTTLTAANTLQIFQANVNADAFMTFHVSGDTAVHFGMDGTTNDLFVGGWSFGANKYKIWHQNNDGTGSGLDADLLDGSHAAALNVNSALTANNSDFLDGFHAAVFVQNTDSRTLSGNLVISGTYFNPSANTILLGNSIQRWVLSANSGDFSSTVNAVTSVNSALLTVGTAFIANTTGAYHTGTVNAASHTVGSNFIANSTAIVGTGFANITTSVNSALLTVGTSFIANTTGAYHTGVVNGASHTVGSSFIANSTAIVGTGFANITTSVNSALLTVGTSFIANTTGAYHTGVVNGASHTVGSNFIANSTAIVGTGYANITTSVNSALLTVGTNFIANTTGVYHTGTMNAASFTVGSSIIANTTTFKIGNTTLTTTNAVFGGTISANGGIGTAKQALVSSAGANAYWATLDMTFLPDATFKKSVRAATTADLGGVTATTTTLTASTLVALPAQDGITLAVGDRLLVKDQATPAQNGIYEVTNLGSAGVTAWILTRPADADSITEIASAIVAVDSGTVNGGHAFDNDTKTTDTLGTTAMSWYHVVDTGGATFVGNVIMGTGSTGIFPLSNTVGNSLGNTISRWALTATTGVFAGAVSGITTLAAGNTTVSGFVNVVTSVAVGANVSLTTSTIFVGNSTVNTSITANQITLNGANVMTTATTLKVYNSAGAQVFP